ncbi:complex I subunit 5 family protein [Myxococcus sp. K15C18031901]|uniref:complex I subunit 5 family protein n=1 Tax=Myxococcus dinghuensis TaxID=2906761 RepID=UPI0020A820C9|nr:complex I subunit 5 family protein [Myxococcus dinghuensis]MCP3100253.1 complex I subunit 5 family protein [Myxococcus dinghuensis]
MSPFEVAQLPVIAALGVPCVLLLAVVVPGWRGWAMRLAPWAALPTVGLALASGAPVHWKSILLGMRLYAPDEVTRTFLLFTGVLWSLSGLFAGGYLRESPHRASFWGFFLSTLVGNVGAVLAQDIASFYLFFALMTFCAYGLVVHERTSEAARAGRVYLVMALLGEALLLAAFFLIAGTSIDLPLREVPRVVAESRHRDLISVLVLVGFGVKVGVVPLHLWLPLAHPVAPTPASAVLSGSIIKVGVLGWLRFLPLGHASLGGVGGVWATLGLVSAFYGVAVGLTQRQAKSVLAYSSVSQMGFLTLAVGLALGAPEAAPALVVAVLVYATHHSLAKGLLFLGAGVLPATGRGGWRGVVVLVGLAWAALEIAGAPLTSGAWAKLTLKSAESAAHAAESLPTWLSVAAVGSTLIMARFLVCIVPGASKEGKPGWGVLLLSWLLLLVADTVVFLRPPVGAEELPELVVAKNVVSAAWPVLLGVSLSAVALASRRWRAWRVPELPPGDLLWFVERLVHPVWAFMTREVDEEEPGPEEETWGDRLLGRFARLRSTLLHEADDGEANLRQLSHVGLALLLFLGVFLYLVTRPPG